jgi:hypothetical protein
MVQKLYGFFSYKQLEYTGTMFYSTPDGREVEVTSVAPDQLNESNAWPDKRLVGEVVAMVRRGLVEKYPR